MLIQSGQMAVESRERVMPSGYMLKNLLMFRIIHLNIVSKKNGTRECTSLYSFFSHERCRICTFISVYIYFSRILLKWGAPTEAVNKSGDTCFHMACSRGHTNIVKLLLETGTTTVQQQNHSWKTPIQVAEANEHDQIVNLLKGTFFHQNLSVVSKLLRNLLVITTKQSTFI